MLALALLLLQVPPALASLNVIIPFEHKLPNPLIGNTVSTVTIVVAVQPDKPASAYVIVAVPLATVDTVPSVPTVAIAELLLLHAPEPPAVNGIDVPAHTGPLLPLITGALITVTVAVVEQPVFIV